MAFDFPQKRLLARRQYTLAQVAQPGLITKTPTTLVINAGQSNAKGVGPNPDNVVVTLPNTAWSILREQFEPLRRYGLSGPLQNGAAASSFISDASYMPAFAKQWNALTGQNVLVADFPHGGTPLVPQASPVYHWAHTPPETSLVGTYELAAGFPRNQLLQDAIDTLECYPGFRRGLRIVIWNNGETDGIEVQQGRLTGAQHQAALDALFTHLKVTYEIDFFFIMAVGRLGVIESEIDVNEIEARIPIRTAQFAVANARADTFIVFNGAKEKGSPLNTFTVDGTGFWSSGAEFQDDGQHWTAAFLEAAGLTAARNAAIYAGLASGTPIGVAA